MSVRIPKDALRAQLVLAADAKMRLEWECELIGACSDYWQAQARHWQREAQMPCWRRWLRRWAP